MSKKPTPETDALANRLIAIAENITPSTAQAIITQVITEVLMLTTKMECERNSARAKFVAAIDGRDMAIEEADKLREDLIWSNCQDKRELQRQIDEARELLASEKITRDHMIERGVEVQRERDEAREAIKSFYKAKGRHNSQIAAAKMFELLGVSAVYPTNYLKKEGAC